MSSEHEDDELVRETVEAARQHYLNDFPNPDRTGCPPFDSLRRVAESSELPDRGVREHLMTCSPCFREFQELRAARSHPASQIVHDQPVGFRSVINPYYLVAALAVLFLGFAFVMLAYCDSRGILVIDDVNSNKAVIPASTDR